MIDAEKVWQHGCCVDRVAFERDVAKGRPLRDMGDRGCARENSCMQLPDGLRCSDCAHVKRCVAMFGQEADADYCQFFPRRFLLRKTETT